MATTPFFSLLPLLCQLPACLSSEIFSFRDQLKRLRHLWVALEENAAGVRYAEAVVYDFVFDGPLNRVLVVLKILLRELNSTLRHVLFELIQKRIRHLERLIERGVLRQEITHERVDGVL